MLDIRNYLKGDRLEHTLCVLENVNLISRDEMRDVKGYLRMAALLHDIGYSEKVKRKNSHHSLDGYLYLRNKVPVIVAYLVLAHTGAEDLVPMRWKWLFLLEKKACEKKLLWQGFGEEKRKNLLTLLNWADTHASPKGEFISSRDRLSDVEERYGKESPVSLSMKRVIEDIHRNL